MTGDALLSAQRLVRHYRGARRGLRGKRGTVHAVDGVSFDIRPGETLGLVGESGCGKSTLGRIVVGIEPPSAGRVVYDGSDLSTVGSGALRTLRREIQIIFQDPLGALDPRLDVARQIREPLDIHDIGTARERQALTDEALAAVGLETAIGRRFPHELSGGQAQRVGIARALIVEPRLLVCDEPVSALDVSVQAQVVDLLADLRARLGIAYLFISHDLRVVKNLSHRIAVMYLGQIVEEGLSDLVFDTPAHPYTRALMSAVPSLERNRQRARVVLSGDPPSPLSPPAGCRFHTRCPEAMAQCAVTVPTERRLDDGRRVSCHLHEASRA